VENINRKRFICCRGQDRELSAKQEKEQKSDMESMKQYFYLYPDMGEDAAVELYKAYYDKGTSAGERICGEALAAKAAAGTEVSPVGIIGYYYPATVYAAENGMLYCVHEYESDVRVFADVEEILAYELQVHRPIRIERRR
jgi:putative asparagine synthase